MKSFGLGCCLLLVACGGSRSYVKVPDVTTQPTQLDLTIDGKAHRVSAKTVGRDTVVEFQGREFVFRNLTGYKGRLSLKEVDLEIGDTEIEITQKRLTVEEKGYKAVLDYAELASDKRMVYAAGTLTME
jgi:hypothetical protein